MKKVEDRKYFLVVQLRLVEWRWCGTDNNGVSEDITAAEEALDCCSFLLSGSMATKTQLTPRPTSASGSAPSV